MRKNDFILGFILITICGVFYFMISQLPEEGIIYPIFVTTILLGLTILHLLITYFKTEDVESEEFKNIEKKQLLFVVGASGIYLFLINILGYLVSTVIFIATTLFGLKVDKKTSAFVSFGFAAFVYILFKTLLNVPLPKGLII